MSSLGRRLATVGLCIVLAGLSASAADREVDPLAKFQRKPTSPVVKPQTVMPAPSEPTPAAPAPTDISSQTATAVGEKIDWYVISSGGGSSSSGALLLDGTAGQATAGQTSSAGQVLHQGYWQSFSTSCCVGVRGNLDLDAGQNVDITDLQVAIDFLFFGGALSACPEENDVAPDGTFDITDLQAIIDFLFFGGSLASC